MQFNTCTNERVEDSEPFDPETERKAIMKWTKEVLSKSEKPNTNSFSHQNSKSKKPPREDSRKQQRSQEEKINSSQKKRDMKLPKPSWTTLTNWCRKGLSCSYTGDEPAEISISVSPETTFEGLKRKISQTTRISPKNQLLILKGKEWLMEEQEKISQCWTTDDLVAIFERKDFQAVSLWNLRNLSA